MRMIGMSLVGAVGLSLSPPAAAQIPAVVCADAAADALKACLAKHYSETDQQLASAYKAALTRAESSGLGRNLIMDWKRALQETQRKWIAYREADCGPPIAYETTKTPAVRDIAQLRCKISHTHARLSRLSKSE